MDAGYYIVRLDVELAANGLDNTDEIFLVIIEDAMQANIAGGTAVQLPWQQDVLLDASKSADPNELSAQLQFEWYCEFKEGGKVKDCFGNGLDEVEFFGPIWLIPKKVLLEGVEYAFHVNVQNTEKRRFAVAKQSVVLFDKELPTLSVKYEIIKRSVSGEFMQPRWSVETKKIQNYLNAYTLLHKTLQTVSTTS